MPSVGVDDSIRYRAHITAFVVRALLLLLTVKLNSRIDDREARALLEQALRMVSGPAISDALQLQLPTRLQMLLANMARGAWSADL